MVMEKMEIIQKNCSLFSSRFWIEKAFNSDLGIKIEAGYRFTMTDYLDDVSGVYADRQTISDSK